MADALGLTLLVVVVTLGLANLAVRAGRRELRVATTVVAALGASMVLAAPIAAVLLLMAAATAGKLATSPVPDTVPADWS